MVADEASGSPLRVLIVEDETLVSLMLCDIVEDAGFSVVGPAMTGEEALQLAEAERPAIAIVDITLHGHREGVAVGAELARRHGLELVFVSGHGGVADWPEVRALAPAAVLQKPCLPRQVIQALKTAAMASAARGEGAG